MKKGLLIENTRGEVPIKHELRKGDRIICPNGDEYSISWNEQWQAVEIVKTYAENAETAINITPAVSNHIYIK